MRAIINENNVEEFKNHILKGRTIKELQDIYSCSRTTITKAKKEFGLVGLSSNIKIKDNGDGTKYCKHCLQNKPLSAYHSNGYSTSGTRKYKPLCKKCEQDKKRITFYIKVRDILLRQDREYACELCGYNKNIAALEFHHFEDEIKDYEISNMSSMSEKTLSTEIEKCALLCSNCHREYHNPLQDKQHLGAVLVSTMAENEMDSARERGT